MRRALAALGMMSIATAAAANSMKNDVVGCTEQAAFEKSVSFLVAGDQDAWVSYLTPKVATGECAMLSAGQQVSLEDISLFSGVACVRPAGKTSCYYVNTESVGD